MSMANLTAVITRGDDQFAAWINEVPGVYGAGDTVEEAKQSLQDGLNLYIEENKVLPEVLQRSYQFIYEYDMPSFLEHFGKVIGKAGLERITGVNQKQLGHYMSGFRKPKADTLKKIEKGLHNFAQELKEIHFI
jgi:predicted RNase H-like HicB family nuclease